MTWATAAKDFLHRRNRRREAWRLFDALPRAIADLRTEANLRVIMPWFLESLSVEGDICEFGCFRGTMSIKFAWLLASLKRTDRIVHAFDTFEGFQVDDPEGSVLGIGAYSDNEDAFAQLTLWSAVLPLWPIKGDARETARQLSRPLSFVWLDLDFAILLGPVLEAIWPLLHRDTIIGLDDVGHPHNPSVLPWVQSLVAAGRLHELARDESACIRFYRPVLEPGRAG